MYPRPHDDTENAQAKEQGIEVRYEDENLWLTQKMMGELFDVKESSLSSAAEYIPLVTKKAYLDFAPVKIIAY